MDTDGSGTITYEELKEWWAHLGSRHTEAEVKILMEVVTPFINFFHSYNCAAYKLNQCVFMFLGWSRWKWIN